ncbi:TrgA family protein [Ponticoccus litoralis]|uniref:TrgA family protein n=1 Tax=Ponticoccus litoralis TaxID=422297 RepID=A0AAW9SAT6_9RHOB
MPTAAKLVAALCLAALGYVASDLIRPLLPASTDFGLFNHVNGLIGLVMGWRVVGRRAGRGMSAAIGNGFTGTAALVFWGLFVQATYEMVRRSFARHYDSIVEAIAAIFELMLEYGEIMLDARVILALLLGGIASGILAEIAAGRWR